MSLVERGEFAEVLAFHRGRVNRHERTVLLVPPVKDSGINIRRRSRGISGYEADRQRREALAARRAKALQKMIADAIEASKKKNLPEFDFQKPSIRVIQKHICAYSGVHINDLNSNRRLGFIIKPRHIGFILSRILTQKSLPEIGREFGGRDHTTILHALQKTEALRVRLVTELDETASIDLWISAAFKGWDELGFK